MGDTQPRTRRTRRAHREAGSSAAAAAPRRRVSVLGVLGEVLITAGVVALLYVSWQMWIGDWIIGAEKHRRPVPSRRAG